MEFACFNCVCGEVLSVQKHAFGGKLNWSLKTRGVRFQSMRAIIQSWADIGGPCPPWTKSKVLLLCKFYMCFVFFHQSSYLLLIPSILSFQSIFFQPKKKDKWWCGQERAGRIYFLLFVFYIPWSLTDSKYDCMFTNNKTICIFIFFIFYFTKVACVANSILKRCCPFFFLFVFCKIPWKPDESTHHALSSLVRVNIDVDKIWIHAHI